MFEMSTDCVLFNCFDVATTINQIFLIIFFSIDGANTICRLCGSSNPSRNDKTEF